MPAYKPTTNAQDVKFAFELYGGPATFSLVIPSAELSSYALGAEILIGDKFIGEVTKRTKVDDFRYLIEGAGLKERLSGVFFKGKYNVYDDSQALLPGAKSITDIGKILDDVTPYISHFGLSFGGVSPYVSAGIAPYNCNITCSVADIITHIAQAAGKGWYIDQNKEIQFADIVRYSGSAFEKEVLTDVVNVLIIKGTLKSAYLDSLSESDKFKYFSTITDNTGLFCPTGYVGQAWQSEDTRFESANKIFIYSDSASITAYGRKEAEVTVPYIDDNSEAFDFALEYFLNNATPIKSETAYTIDITEEYPHAKGARKTFCRLQPTGQLRADYYYFGSEDSIFNTEFIKGVKDVNSEKLINELDRKPPKVRLISSDPEAHTKSYKKVKNPIYLASYAKDDVSVSSVKFYLSRYNTGTQSWGSYSLIGSGAWQSAPDSESEGYYEYSPANGYYDLIVSGGLARGDIFRVKAVAKDSSGNAGEHVREYQLDDNPPRVVVNIEMPSKATPVAPDTPSVLEISSVDGFRLKVDIEDQSVTAAPVVKYYKVGGYDTINTTKIDSGNEHYYITDNMARPAKGKYRRAEVTVTNAFGKETISNHYVKGVEKPAGGVPTIVRDHGSGSDETTTTAPEYKDKIEFSATFKDRFYIVNIADVKFNIYNEAGTKVKTLEHGVTYTITENDGTFSCNTDVATLALAAGLYSVACEMVKHEYFIDEFGVEQDDASAPAEGSKSQFQLVSATKGSRIGSNYGTLWNTDGVLARMTPAEEETNVNYSAGTKRAQVKFFEAASAPDGLGDGWFGTNDNKIGTPSWYRMSADDPVGTSNASFTINKNDSAESYTYLLFKNGGTNEGAIRFDAATPKVQMTTNYQDASPTWTDIATGAANKIEDDYISETYELKVNSSDGSLTFKNIATPATLLEVQSDGTVIAYSDILPNTTNTKDLGSAANAFKDCHLDGALYLDDIGDATSNWRIEWDGVNGIAIPHNVAMGFWED